MSARLSGRGRIRGPIFPRSWLRAVAFGTVALWCVVISVPGASAGPSPAGGGVPSPKMFGYAAGPAEHLGTAAGRPHYVPASATQARLTLGAVSGHPAPVPASAPPPVGSRTLVVTGSAPMAAGHLVLGSASGSSAQPSASASPSPSASLSPSASPTPSASPSPSAAASPSPTSSASSPAGAPAALTALMQGGGTDNASYSVASSFDTVPMADQTGRIAVTVTNTGTSTWSGYALGSQVFPSGDTNGTGTPLTTGASVGISATVAPGGNATVESVTPAENPGSYEICWDMVNASGTYFSAEGGNEYCAPYTIQQYPPAINEQEPLPGTDVDSQTPELSASAVVPGGYPANPVFSYAFRILNGPNPSTATVVASSGWVANSGSSWTPTTSLTWGTTYYWQVTVSDAVPPPSLTGSGITWTTPISFVVGNAQPTISGRLGNAYEADDGNPIMTSDLGGTDYSGSGKTVDPRTGNVSLQGTDVSVATVGPALAITRTYNSLDPRTAQALGAGWSSLLDMSLVPDPDGSGALILTLADGQQVRFAKNSAGGYAPPQDMYAVVATISGGGFSVTDQTGTTYDFAQPSGSSWLISQITDNTGKAETFSYSSGVLTTITNTTSGHALHVTWSTPSGAAYPHVATISTDPVTAGQPTTALTWTYGYNGDLLTSVCPPGTTTACATYSYITNGSHAPTSVLNADPTSYYRLDEPAGATAAVNQIPADDQIAVDPPADEFGTTPGVAGPVAGVTATSFNGNSSFIPLDGAWCTTPGQASSCKSIADTGRVLTGGTTDSVAVSLWFKTSTASGVLLGLTGALPSSCGSLCTGTATPLLWIGSNGDLQGYGGSKAISSSAAVDNGAWHQAVLIPGQALYLDGAEVATSTGGFTAPTSGYALLGAGTIAENPYYSSWSYFNGSMADVSIYHDQLPSIGTVAAQYAAETHPAAELSSITSPAGRTEMSATYDTVNDRVSSLTDPQGGVWNYSGLVPGASTAAYDGAVMGSSPEDFWPLNDTSGPLAQDLVGSAANSASPRPPATYANVTLGMAGPAGFANGSAASFNGSTSQVSIPGGYFAGTGAEAVELWFSTKSDGTLLSSSSPQNGGAPMALWLSQDIGSGGGYCLEGMVGSTLVAVNYVGFCESANVADGKWHQAILTLSPPTTCPAGSFTCKPGSVSETATLYQDGTSIATAQITPGSASATGYTAYLGTGPKDPQPGQPDGPFTGSIADVSFYSGQLTSTEVTSHYETLESQDLPSGVTVSAIPPVNTQTATVTNPVGTTSTYVYSSGTLVRTTNLLRGVTYYGYDAADRVSTVTDPEGDTTYTTFDAHNNVTSVTTCVAVNSCQTSYASYYEDLSNPLDPRNDRVTDERDARSSSPSDPTYDTVTSYTSTGQLAAVTSPPTSACPSGCKTAYAYTTGSEAAVGGGTEPAGLLASVTSPSGGVTSYAYDSVGDVMQVTNPLGLVTKYTYDPLGRELTQTQISDSYPAGLTTSYTYDGLDRPVTETDPPVTDRVTGAVHTEVTSYTYDADSDVLTATVSDTTGGDPSRTTTNTYNSHGQLASVSDPQGNMISYTYNTLGYEATETEPNGQVTAFAYDPAGDLLTTTLEGYTGNPSNPIPPENLVEDSRAYDPAGRLASVTNVMGTTTYYTYYDNDELASSSVLVAGSTEKQQVITYGYDAARDLVTETDPGSLVTDSTYNAASQMVSQTQDPSGADLATTVSFDAGGNVIANTLSQGGSTQTGTATYNAMGQELSQTVQDGSANLTTTYTRDKRGLITSVTDPDGNTTDIQNDEAGRPVVVTGPAVQAQNGTGAAPVTANPVVTVGYDTFGDQTEYSDADGNVTTAAYDTDGQEVSVTDPSYTPPGSSTPVNGTTTVTFNNLGQETKVTDPLGNVTQFTYDQLGDLASKTNPGGGVWTYTYDPAGEQTSVTDPTGAQTQATYDGLGHLITTTDLVRQNTSAAYTTTYGYNDAGEQVSQATPTGVPTTAAYNPLGELISSTDGAGNITSYAYNLDGNPAKVTLPDGTATAFSYDPSGRPVGISQLNATGTVLRSASVSYDADGTITSTTDFRGDTSTDTYDAMGNLLSQTQPVSAGNSITVKYGYDLNGSLTALTDGNGNTTYTTHNSLGLPQTVTEPPTAAHGSTADSTTTGIYDANGDLVTQDLPGGVQINSSYNALGELTSQSGTGASAPTATRTFTYDGAGRLLTAATSAAGTQGTPGYQAPTSGSFTYDDRGLLLAASGSAGSSTFTYNASAQLTSATEAAGTSSYTYDSAGRLATDTDAASGTTGTYGYNTLDQVTQISYGTGDDTQSFGYDSLHRLTSDTVATSGGAQVAAIDYGYNANDDVTSMATSGLAAPGGGTGTVTNTYGYDLADRLTSWTSTPAGGSPATKTYGYDAAGNLVNDNGVTYTYDARDELISDSNGNTYTYTASGDLTGEAGPGGTTTSASDAYGQQVTAGSASSYTYDALGRLLTAANLSTNSVIALTYDGMTDQVASDSSATYSRDPAGALVGVDTAAGGQTLALSDQHGDLAGVFTAAGTSLTGSTTYDPWGQVLAAAGPTIQVGYQGQWTDPATQQVDMGTRFYRPGTGGFGNQDTYTGGEGGTAVTDDLHAYADDNPLSATDPTGESPSSPGGGTSTVTAADVQAAAEHAAALQLRAANAAAAARSAAAAAAAAQRAASADAEQARTLNSDASSLWAQYNTVNDEASAAYDKAQQDQGEEGADLADIARLASEWTTITKTVAQTRWVPATPGTQTKYCNYVIEYVNGIPTLTCVWTTKTTPGTPGHYVTTYTTVTERVRPPGVAEKIQKLESAANQAQRDAATENSLGAKLAAKAANLKGQWTKTEEEATVAAGQAAQALAYANHEQDIANSLSQVANADLAAAEQAEEEYLYLLGVYEHEHQKNKNTTGHPHPPGGLKTPPKPRLPSDAPYPVAPPTPSGTPYPEAPPTPSGSPYPIADQGPTINADTGGEPPATEDGGTTGNEDEPNPFAKPVPEQDPPSDQWVAYTGTPLQPVVVPDTENPPPPKGFWRRALYLAAKIAEAIHSYNGH